MVNIFLTGASGYIGSHLTPLLLEAGHKLTALARSDASACPFCFPIAKKLEDQGITVIRASLEDTDALFKAASEADAVIHLAFVHDFANFAKALETDYTTVETFAKALKGTSKILITTSGLLAAASPTPSELTPAIEAGRGKSDRLTLSLAASGIRSHVIRLAPTTHGDGDHGLLTFYIQQSKKAGFAGYVGEGGNHWPAVHVDDAVKVYKLVLESKTLKGGEVLHAVQDAGIPFKSIADAVAHKLGIPTKSLTQEEVEDHYARLARFFSRDLVAESTLTREWLGWAPAEKGLVEDIESSEWYFTPEAVSKY
ncbi:hypothetical protein I350_01741 [Cryptococcus amylolentus CBS 6273]|uniref:NAD-dependent epimerase/dehydratase domain-containing protein n=1 Tax=Cryptococcus amylolentus CBS 6273 TaxID=1296118 RepID=A0A1E3KDG3_9TREE|nr:hypothetical protein I350_01741 [Cryptococcus amylolentus CBS 6273]